MEWNLDFSYGKYEKLLRILSEVGYVHAFFNEDNTCKTSKKVYLRHDVDIDIDGVLPLAEVEAKQGYVSTWFFLADSDAYNLQSDLTQKILLELAAYGHVCGLHVDAAKYVNFAEMQEDVERQYRFYSNYVPLKRIISFHRPLPEMLIDCKVQCFVSVYEKRFYSDIMYISDSNRREFWKEDRLRNAVQNQMDIQLLTHPIWWYRTNLSPQEAAHKIIDSKVKLAKRCLSGNCKMYNEKPSLMEGTN